MQYLHHPSCCGLSRRLLLIHLSLPNSHVRPDSRFPDIASWHLDLHADPDPMCRKLVAERRLQVVPRTVSTNGMANARRPTGRTPFPPAARLLAPNGKCPISAATPPLELITMRFDK